MASTIHSTTEWELIARKWKRPYDLRGHHKGEDVIQLDQLKILVDYNRYIGATDTFNHLVQALTTARTGQRKWIKKFISWLIDIAQVNAFII